MKLCSASRLLTADDPPHAAIIATLERFGEGALHVAHRAGITIAPLAPQTCYAQASPALRRLGVDVDSWPRPPAGLFVVEERRIYLRSHSPMTVAHEFGHALDCALGGGVYRSSSDEQLRSLFTAATHFVTAYAATSIDEYFAEALRAYVECNDPASLWPRVTRERLRTTDADLYRYVERLFKVEFLSAA